MCYICGTGKNQHISAWRFSHHSFKHPCLIIRYAKLKFMTILQSLVLFGTRSATFAEISWLLVVILTTVVEKMSVLTIKLRCMEIIKKLKNKDLIEDALPGPCLTEWLSFIEVRINPPLLLRHHRPLRL